MMSNAHIAVGIASALAIAQTGSPETCAAAVIGGSIGGIIADCDITPSRIHKDALRGRLIVAAIALAAIIADYVWELGVCIYILDNVAPLLLVGIALFVLLTFIGAHTKHRTFTHSIVALAAFTFAMFCICEPLTVYFAAGYISHLVLDITNKHSIRLFFPLKADICLGLFPAKGAANTFCFVAGVAASLLLLWIRIAPLLVVD